MKFTVEILQFIILIDHQEVMLLPFPVKNRFILTFCFKYFKKEADDNFDSKSIISFFHSIIINY